MFGKHPAKASTNLEEFRDLCLRLGVDYDNLGGETLSVHIRNLVQHMDRHGRLDDLLNFCVHLRPRVDWPDLSSPVDLDATPTPFMASERNPRQIFLSHARQDADFAHQLAADLRHHEWEVWIAPDSIHPGEKWVDAINRGLAESGIFLLVLTPDTVNFKWVHCETDTLIAMAKREEAREQRQEAESRNESGKYGRYPFAAQKLD
ncbi:MAG: toll/interleukin-1 receptor domain-containing protein [Chloroflexi bacterium]|nr:toll/interleukin-1 receptor domain-containing protein [Chloroflexota bacterium]